MYWKSNNPLSRTAKLYYCYPVSVYPDTSQIYAILLIDYFSQQNINGMQTAQTKFVV